ncbi:Arylsulfatase [Symbiodinium microadriaticum]|uniref:Arylsulfatase n=1 Tax=Symbiodinium microadriaticum TaxID=2951 RepID=A0A1Q9EMI0_SYMMI|nr:Arylsulfatase [Symbiodinium microadriaticum]
MEAEASQHVDVETSLVSEADDIGWGELGWQGGGKHRGTPTDGLDAMAFEGMRFWSSYAALSAAGYHTAMWGKWRLGCAKPFMSRFDYAYYGLFNGAPDNWPESHDMYESSPSAHRGMFYDFPGVEAYREETGIDLSERRPPPGKVALRCERSDDLSPSLSVAEECAFVGRRGEPRKRLEGPAGTLGPRRQEYFEEESINQITRYVREKAKDEKPFFIYWATYTQQLQGSTPQMKDPHVDKANAQEGIAENTLVVWFSDNGPMYAFFPNSGYSWLRGGKGTVLEGGVRVPAMAWWPGMIQPRQDPVDLLHLTALRLLCSAFLFDRVLDGVDQAPLLLLGEGHGRRLGAIRHKDFKVHLKESKGGLPNMEFYNVRRDPGEKYGEFYKGLFAVTPIQRTVQAHKRQMHRFPNRGELGETDMGSCPPHA